MKLTVILAAFALATIKIEKLPTFSDILLPGSKVLVFPVKVAHLKPEAEYEITILCASDAYAVQTCNRLIRMKGSEINAYLATQEMIVEYKSAGSLTVSITVQQLQAEASDKMHYELKSPAHIELQDVREKIDPKSRLALQIAKIAAPFDSLELEVNHDGLSKHYKIIPFKGGVELQVLDNTITGILTYTVKDKNSELASLPQKIEVVPLIKRNKSKLGIILISASAVLIVLMLVGMVVQIKFHPFSRNKNKNVIPISVSPPFGTVGGATFTGRAMATN